MTADDHWAEADRLWRAVRLGQPYSAAAHAIRQFGGFTARPVEDAP